MIIRTINDRKQIAKETSLMGIFGNGFTKQQLDNAFELEIRETTLKDAGSDYCLFILRDQDGNDIGERKINGY